MGQGSKKEEPVPTSITSGKLKQEMGRGSFVFPRLAPHIPRAGQWGKSALRALRTP